MKSIVMVLMFLAAGLCAQDIDALLQRLKAENAVLNKAMQEREARFRLEKAERKTMLDEARSELAGLKQRSRKLQAQFDTHEALIAGREKQLKERMGNLGELFGVVRQSAGDLNGIVRSSVVSAQFPHRADFLKHMSESKRLPSSEDLEKLWLAMLEEMVESGKTATFEADVVRSDGTTEPAGVTRIGLFSVASDGKYLRFDGQKGQLIELPRQPAGRYMRYVDTIGQQGGIITAVIDPTRGALFELMMEKPTLTERIHQGGLIGYVILMLGAAGLLLATVRLILLLREGARVNRQLGNLDTPSSDNALGRVLNVYRDNVDESVGTIESRLDEAILKELPAITRGESLIKLLAAVAPLLGLLGTVVGMIETFQAITLFGTGDPKLMAGGISQALVTTMLGLIVAVPLLFAHSLVRSRSKLIIEVLSQQSAGMIARRMEQR